MKIEEEIRDRIQPFIEGSGKNMGHALGIEFVTFSREEMKATMPVNQNTVQPMRILHGGASVALAETLASIGAYLNIREEGKTAVGLEINANHVRPVPEGGVVTGVSRPIHRGSQTQVWETRITDQNGKLVSISRCTLAIVKRG
ncbi:MAG: hotdog fold thioesterase [Balneolaceae bacterium]